MQHKANLLPCTDTRLVGAADSYFAVNAMFHLALTRFGMETCRCDWTGLGTHCFAISAAGRVRAEIQDADGKALPGFALDDCPPLFGDTIERAVTWKNGGDISALAGKAVRLRFEFRDADVCSFSGVE
jgi:hypothetical protein